MRRLPSLRRTLALAAASALLVALAGCASDDPDTAADEASSSAPADPDDEGESAEPAEPASGEAVDLDDFLARLQAAQADVTTARTSMTMDMGAVQTSADGVVDYTTDPPSMSMQMEMPAMGGGTLDVRMVDGVMYMNMGAMTQGKFFKIDPSEPGGPFGDMGDMTDSMDPMESFEEFASAFEEVTFVGDENVEGDTLAHYRLTLDTGKVKAWRSGGEAAEMPKRLTYDLWLDADDRVRRAEMTMGKLGSMTMTMGEFGEPVQIVAPPPNKIVEMPGLTGAA